MELIRALSSRVETEQTRKLQELSSNSASDSRTTRSTDIMSFGGTGSANGNSEPNENDFERLVLGKSSDSKMSPEVGWDSSSQAQPSSTADTPVFSWSTQSRPAQPTSQKSLTSLGMGTLTPQQPSSRSITPDLSSFAALSPSSSSTQAFAPLQPQSQPPPGAFGSAAAPTSWQSKAPTPAVNPWDTTQQRTSSSPSLSTLNSLNKSTSSSSFGQSSAFPSTSNAFSIAPPPTASSAFMSQPPALNAFSIPPPQPNSAFGSTAGTQSGQVPAPQSQKGGLDRYESLL